MLESLKNVVQQIIRSQLGDVTASIETEPIDEQGVDTILIIPPKSTAVADENAGKNQRLTFGHLLVQIDLSFSTLATECTN